MGSSRRRLAFLLLPLLILLPGLAGFPYASGEASFSDISISHYPNAVYLRSALLEYGALPLWSPMILSGAPFFTNPLSGIWYPPGWLALLLPLPLGFNLLLLLHWLWGGLGMYSLLRAEKLGWQAALFGALAFEAMPKLFAHYGAGHLTLLYALPWTPWLLWAQRTGRGPRLGNRPLLPGVILALIFLADVRWAAYAGATWWAYGLLHGAQVEARRGGAALVRRLDGLLLGSVLAGCLAAPLALPLLEYTAFSTRAHLTVEDILTLSLPPERLLGLLFPDFGGAHEWMVYCGAATLLLGLAAALRRPDRERGFWLGLVSLALIFSLGSLLPGMEWLARLPFFSLLRVPARALFLSGMALAALAAHQVQAILTGAAPEALRRTNLALAGLAGFGLALSGGVWTISGGLPLNFAWGGAALLLGAAWIGLGMGGRLARRTWLLGLFLLALVDWGGIDLSLFEMRPAQAVFAEGAEAAGALAQAAEGQALRIYSPSYSLPQQTAVHFGLQLADGVDPLQLQNYVAFMLPATGVPWAGYSVTLPSFAGGQPALDNAAYRPDVGLLRLLNIHYIAAEFDLPLDGLRLQQQIGETRLYQVLDPLPRAWVQPESVELGEQTRPVQDLRWSPNRIEMTASGPGLLVLSEIAYPGWQVWVDGERAQVEPVFQSLRLPPSEEGGLALSGLLRGVRLEAGEHAVTFAFRPGSLWRGLGLCAVGLLFLLWAAFRTGKPSLYAGWGREGAAPGNSGLRMRTGIRAPRHGTTPDKSGLEDGRLPEEGPGDGQPAPERGDGV